MTSWDRYPDTEPTIYGRRDCKVWSLHCQCRESEGFNSPVGRQINAAVV